MEYNPGLQKVFTDKTYKTAKSMNDKENLVFRDNLQKTNIYDHIPTKGRMSGRDKYIKKDLDKDVRRILNLNTTLGGRGMEKIVIACNIIDIYTRLEISLGIRLSGHTDTLTEANNSVEILYKRGEM